MNFLSLFNLLCCSVGNLFIITSSLSKSSVLSYLCITSPASQEVYTELALYSTMLDVVKHKFPLGKCNFTSTQRLPWLIFSVVGYHSPVCCYDHKIDRCFNKRGLNYIVIKNTAYFLFIMGLLDYHWGALVWWWRARWEMGWLISSSMFQCYKQHNYFEVGLVFQKGCTPLFQRKMEF